MPGPPCSAHLLKRPRDLDAACPGRPRGPGPTTTVPPSSLRSATASSTAWPLAARDRDPVARPGSPLPDTRGLSDPPPPRIPPPGGDTEHSPRRQRVPQHVTARSTFRPPEVHGPTHPRKWFGARRPLLFLDKSLNPGEMLPVRVVEVVEDLGKLGCWSGRDERGVRRLPLPTRHSMLPKRDHVEAAHELLELVKVAANRLEVDLQLTEQLGTARHGQGRAPTWQRERARPRPGA